MTSEWIVETTDERFENDVMEASKKVLVVVDFWAAWCQPCRLLAPILEEVVEQQQGKVKLVKAESDYNPNAATQFGVQGIPALFAIGHGKIIGNVNGALPKRELEQWIAQQQQLFDIVAADAEIETDPSQAVERLQKLVNDDVQVLTTKPLLCRALAASKRWDEAKELIAELEKRGFLEPEIEAVKTEIELQANVDVDVDSCRKQFEEQPTDSKRCSEYALALAAHDQYETAFETLLTYIQTATGDDRDHARETMVELFRVTKDEELVSKYRRKLSMALF